MLLKVYRDRRFTRSGSAEKLGGLLLNWRRGLHLKSVCRNSGSPSTDVKDVPIGGCSRKPWGLQQELRRRGGVRTTQHSRTLIGEFVFGFFCELDAISGIFRSLVVSVFHDDRIHNVFVKMI